MPIYNTERGLDENSGRTGACHYLLITIGVLMNSLIGMADIKRDEGVLQIYISFAFPIITCIIRMVIFWRVYKLDTAKYYVLTAQVDKAMEVIAKIAKDEYIEQ